MKKVLVIDDESSIRQVLKIHLAAEGYEVVAVDNAADGIEAAGKGVDLVICDYHLPDMNGLKVVGALRARHGEMPVLMISGFLDDRLSGEAAASGATGLLRKPFQKSVLIDAVAAALSINREHA